MDDQSFDELVRDGAHSYREPPNPPLDAMWAQIEHEHFGTSGRAAHRRSWLRPALGIAAGLVLGIGIGRLTAPRSSTDGPVAGVETSADARGSSEPRSPYRAVTTRYLGQAAALLVALPGRADRAPDARLLERAGELLSTTRILLDSPAAENHELKTLLDDLELVLAQIVRLSAPRHSQELELITDALTERDVLPRLQDAVTHSLTAPN